ncbi:hypothetical protein ASE14_12210 [Agromyces sp. Root81]|nr:hypothetical protein ASE14_12210 [Agromyces sp. Root81]
MCGALSVIIGAGALWIVISTARSGGEWTFSVIASIVPLLFALQGLRLSGQPGTRWPRFSRVSSIVGAVLGVAAFAGFLYLLSISTNAL